MFDPDRPWTRREFLKLAGQAGLLSTVPTLASAAAALNPDTVCISILHTTDLHGHMLPTRIATIKHASSCREHADGRKTGISRCEAPVCKNSAFHFEGDCWNQDRDRWYHHARDAVLALAGIYPWT